VKKALAIVVIIGAAGAVCGAFAQIDTATLGLGMMLEFALATALSIAVLVAK
jgi:hypothetical protein